jgi:hypothetical protein
LCCAIIYNPNVIEVNTVSLLPKRKLGFSPAKYSNEDTGLQRHPHQYSCRKNKKSLKLIVFIDLIELSFNPDS